MKSFKKRKKKLPQWLNSKFISILAIIIIAAIIPLTVIRSTQRTSFTSLASPSTTLTFSQATVQANIGDPISLNINMDPGTNAVSFITLVIDYDSSIVTPTSSGIVAGTIPGSNPPTQFSIFDGPTYNNCNGTQCNMSVTLTVGNDFTKAIKVPGTIATVNFQAVGNTTQAPMQLSFDQSTNILSIASGDSPGQNVLNSSTPTQIAVGAPGNFSPVPTTSSPTPPNTTITTNPSSTPSPSITTIPTPKPTGNACDNDAEKKREKDETDREKKEAAREKNEILREQQTQTIIQSQKDLTGKGRGGCLGQFDPNNPNKDVNCDKNANPSKIQNAQQSGGNIFDNVGGVFKGLFFN